jgi:hypothetical protein
MATQKSCNVWSVGAGVFILELSCLVENFTSKVSNAEHTTVVASCRPEGGVVAARSDNGLRQR